MLNYTLSAVGYEVANYGKLSSKVTALASVVNIRHIISIAQSTDEPIAYRNAARIVWGMRKAEAAQVIAELNGFPF